MEVVGSSVVAYVSWDRGCWNRLRRARRRERVLTVEVVGSSVVAYVNWVRGGCYRLGRARNREMILYVGVVGSSVTACIACVVVTAAVVAER